MAALTLPGVLLTGTHAGRPAATAVGTGTLYACSDHSLIYQSDGASWSTWATLGTTGSVATDAIWDAAGDLAVGSGSNTASKLSAGATAGHVLTSNGSAAAPSWQAAGSGGALVLLEQHTANNSSDHLDFTTFISSTYDEYLIEGTALVVATSTANLLLECGTGGGPTYDTGNNYEWAWGTINTSGSSAANDAAATGLPRIFQSMSTNGVYGVGQFSMRATELQSTSHRKTFYGTKHFVNSGPASVFGTGGIQYTATTAVTALRFITSTGNIVSGTIRIYGIAK
jgi:hypothetical protein